MAKVFISYAHEDLELARKLAEALDDYGHEVWWDAKLRIAEEYRPQILEQAHQATAVIVIWTEASVKRPWVVAEAQIGADRGVLVQVRFEHGVRAPAGFDQVHMLNLFDSATKVSQSDVLKIHEKVVYYQSELFLKSTHLFTGPMLKKIRSHEIGRSAIAVTSNIFGLATHRFLRGALLSATGVTGLQLVFFMISHAIHDDTIENIIDYIYIDIISSIILISFARFCAQLLYHFNDKEYNKLHFFDPSFSWWLSFFGIASCCIFIMSFEFKLPMDHPSLDPILLGLVGLSLLYMVRGLASVMVRLARRL